MTCIRFSSFLAVLVLSLSFAQAQTSDNRWMAGLSAIFMDYQGPLTGDYLQARSFDPGITMGAHAYLTPLLNLSVNSSFVPEASYPITQDNILRTSLIDANVLARVKLNNGKLLREDALLAPYIGSGFGLNSASNNVRLYIPAVLGLQIQVSKNFSLQLETTYKQPLKKGATQPLTHSAGFVFALPGNSPPPKRPVETKMEDTEMLVDSDKDGVPDRNDVCPDVKGKAMYLGCPDAPATEPEEAIAENETDPAVEQHIQEIQLNPNPAPQQTPAGQTQIQDGNPDRITITQPEAPLRPISEADQAYLEKAMRNVYFEKGSDILTNESLTVLDTVAQILNRNDQYDLDVLGHTDNTGNATTNVVLSVKRAFKVKYYLVYDKGVRMSRINSDGYSSAAPLYDNSTAEGRAKNRRVEFKLHPTKKYPTSQRD
jgi:outer membrane protein OmpA-like peptidoglycan-associated protein